MAISLKNNINALQSQRMLSQSLLDIEKTSRSLASGSRINRPSDDAAGLSLSTKLLTKNRILSRSLLNLSDGISVSNIMSGSLLELSSITSRIGELAEQSANGTFTDKQREALDNEAQALRDEYYRIANTTEFNGVKLFTDTDGQKIRLQAGNTSVAGALYLTMPNITGQTGTVDTTVTTTTTSTTGDGILTIGTTANSLSSFSVTQYEDILEGDFNNDGISDMMVQSTHTETGNTRLEVRLSDGVGGYTTSTVVNAAGNFQVATRVGDLNGDGNLDISGNFRVWTGNGDGSFTFQYVNFFLSNDLLIDVNNDGHLDAVDYTNNNGGVWSTQVKLGDGNGNFGANIYSGNLVYGNPNLVDSGDVNGDGNIDLLMEIGGGG